MATIWSCVSFIVIAFSFRFCEASHYPVPLLIWSTKSVEVDDEILAGHTLTYDDVEAKYLDKLKTQSKTICLFVQDKLSIDDFAAHRNKDLKHLKEVLHSSPTSIVLPSVSLQLDEEGRNNKLVENLEKESYGSVIPVDTEDVSEFANRIKSLRRDEPVVIIVRLPKARIGEDSMRNLEPSDEIIGKMSEVLASHFADYVGLLTANMPRDDVRAGMADARQLSVSHARERRAIADEAEDDEGKISCNQTGVLVAKDNATVYITNLYLHANKTHTDTMINTTNKILPESDITVDKSSGLSLSFPLKDVFVNESSVTMTLLFNKSNIRWWCVSIAISWKMQNESIDATYKCDAINVPIDKSYSCQVNLNISDNSTFFLFQGLQLQPYGSINKTFANTYDCVGFFTPPIWMGLISVGVLVAILYGGMLALLSIKSMDRFDNPKDPPMVIHSE